MDAFLENHSLDEVDRVLELVKNLATCDDKSTSKAIHDADAYLSHIESKKGFSRTVVNKSKPNVPAGQNTDVTAFMSAVEKDVAERAERRNRQRVRAEKLKNKANVFFKAGDWPRAVELYTQAIGVAKDWEILYTNRAQANLRLGDATAALADCDAAIFLLDRRQPHSDTQSDGVACRVERPVEPDAGLAKAHLHRGKALVALGRPSEGLQAYAQSRDYAPTEPRRPSGDEDTPWPGYLAGYVAQAEAAVAAQLAEVKAQQLFDETAVRTAGSTTSSETGDSTRSSQLVTLLARLARGNQPVAYYVAGFRQLIGLFEMAPKTAVGQTTGEAAAPSANSPVTPSPSSRTSQRGRQHNRQKRGSGRKQNNLDRPVVLDTTPVIAEKVETDETLECLQTLFRIKKGFSLLSREIDVVWSSFEPYLKAPSCSSPVDSSPSNGTRANDHPGGGGQQRQQIVVNTTDRLLVLLHLANYLAEDCPENQRLLVENHGNLLSLAFKCLLMQPGLVSWIIAHIGVDDSSPAIDNNSSSRLESHNDARVQHKAESLRLSASVLVASLTSHASGRQALLTRFGPSVLFDAVAKCLADSLSINAAGQFAALISRLQQQQQRESTRATDATHPLVVPGLQPAPTQANSAVITATAVCCAAQITKVLEHVTSCPTFLLSANSSTSSLESLVAVIEAAVSAAATSTGSSSSTTTNTSCLASLLDSLAAACYESRLRVSLLQRRQPLLRALAHCLQRHAGLFTDANHARLVGSICRLLHNIFVGDHSGQETAAAMDDSCLAGSPLTTREALLTGVGTVLDQPGIGPEIRAVAVALAGRLLPLCSAHQVLHWLGNIQATHTQTIIPSSQKPGNDSDRCQLLLTILDSCSLLVTANPKATDTTSNCADGQPVNGAASGNTTGADQLSSHLLGGCVRCLAAGSMHSLALRYAIGDDRRRVRRLARLLRVRLPRSAVVKSTTVRDEVLAGNVCLILQHCCEDTPLAEHLQATSIICDLLSLIQESKRLDTKRNAAILVGKLAHSSHVHRNELSRLDGWSVLTPFNSWSARLGLT